MEEKKLVKKIWHPDYPIEITGLTEKGVEKVISEWIKEWKKDLKIKEK